MAVKKYDVPELGSVHIYKRRGASSIRVSVGHGGEVRVSMPTWLPYRAGLEFALSKRTWLESQRVVVAPLTQDTRIGKSHHISFVPLENRKSVTTRTTNTGEIRIYYPASIPVEHPAVQKAAHQASLRALKQQAEKLLPQRLQSLAIQYGFNYRSVSIKQLKSRWGSCSSQKDIALNSFLMQLPWHLIDYVLLHELTHTRVMAHGKPFWDELGQHIPNLKAVRKEIKEYRPALLGH